MVGLLQAGVSHDEVSTVEHVVRDQTVEPLAHPVAELGRLRVQLGQGLGEPVAALHVAPCQGALQLRLVVAHHGQRVAGRGHAHREAQDAGGVGSAVDEVAEEDDAASAGVTGVDRTPLRIGGDLVAEASQQVEKLKETAVHVADHVERAGLVAQVVVQPVAHDRGGVDLLGRPQHVHLPEPLAGQPAQRLVQQPGLAPLHV